MFFKLASINYDIYNKMIKDQNKQNTKDPEIKILKFKPIFLQIILYIMQI